LPDADLFETRAMPGDDRAKIGIAVIAFRRRDLLGWM
jgi:hypothetical protein